MYSYLLTGYVESELGFAIYVISNVYYPRATSMLLLQRVRQQRHSILDTRIYSIYVISIVSIS